MICKTPHRKLKMVQRIEGSTLSERLAVPAPHVSPVVLLLNDTNIWSE